MATDSPAQAAEVSGFSIDTLRYYEREGILQPIARTSGGHRAYTDDDLGWLDLVHCLRDTGMPIADLKQYAELSLDEATLRRGSRCSRSATCGCGSRSTSYGGSRNSCGRRSRGIGSRGCEAGRWWSRSSLQPTTVGQSRRRPLTEG